MNILVTGGAGFMGKAIVNDLLAHGHTVRVLDKNTESLVGIKNERLELVRGGIEDAAKVIISGGMVTPESQAKLKELADQARARTGKTRPPKITTS